MSDINFDRTKCDTAANDPGLGPSQRRSLEALEAATCEENPPRTPSLLAFLSWVKLALGRATAPPTCTGKTRLYNRQLLARASGAAASHAATASALPPEATRRAPFTLAISSRGVQSLHPWQVAATGSRRRVLQQLREKLWREHVRFGAFKGKRRYLLE